MIAVMDWDSFWWGFAIGWISLMFVIYLICTGFKLGVSSEKKKVKN